MIGSTCGQMALVVDRANALALEIIDIARIDHFRGFAASWEIPGGDKTAERGSWVETPGRELFTASGRRLASSR